MQQQRYAEESQGLMSNQGFGQSPYDQRQGAPRPPSILNGIWFGADVLVIICALIGVVFLFISLQFIDVLEFMYLLFFAILLAILDTPLFSNVKIVPDLRDQITRYVNILKRVTGRGVVYIFLGSTLWAGMWANLTSTLLLVITALLSLPVLIVGLGSILIGVIKSYNFERVKMALKTGGPGQGPDAMYQSHAKMQAHIGMTKEEFIMMARSIKGMVLTNEDVTLYFNAMSSNPNRNFLSREDLQRWVSGGMVFL